MSAEASAGHAIPREVEQAIKRQRAQLMRVSTVLTCLWISTLYQKWHDVEIEADDVALLLRRVIDEAVDALDIVVLARAAENSDDGQELFTITLRIQARAWTLHRHIPASR
jgi:hypothetical protein